MNEEKIKAAIELLERLQNMFNENGMQLMEFEKGLLEGMKFCLRTKEKP